MYLSGKDVSPLLFPPSFLPLSLNINKSLKKKKRKGIKVKTPFLQMRTLRLREAMCLPQENPASSGVLNLGSTDPHGVLIDLESP